MKGKTNWKVVTGGNVSSPTIGADGTIYVGSQDGNLWTISPSGKPGWKASIGVGGDPEAWAPAVAPDGSIYIDEFAPLVQSLHLYAFTATGAPKWGPISVPPVYNHSPVVGGDGTVYLGSGGGLCAYSPDTGEQLWCALADSVVNDPSIGADGTLYVGVDHELAAIAPDGSVLWKKPGLPSPDGVGSPIVGGDGLLYGTAWGAGGGLYLMMPTGALLATDPIGTGAFSIPALGADGTLYAFGYDGSLYAFEAP
jgi:outer membrane protein assembly factor BamB